MNRRLFVAAAGAVLAVLTPRPGDRALGQGVAPTFTFPSIDGGTLSTADWRGRPVLVVNTASMCGFTGQLSGMQALHDRLGPRGLVVLAVPSDDFAQEYDDAAAVKEFCEVQYGLTLPMTDILHVTRGDVHPFYRWLKDAHGFSPSWNFNKVLLDGQGRVAGTWGSVTKPESGAITQAVEALLPQG